MEKSSKLVAKSLMEKRASSFAEKMKAAKTALFARDSLEGCLVFLNFAITGQTRASLVKRIVKHNGVPSVIFYPHE